MTLAEMQEFIGHAFASFGFGWVGGYLVYLFRRFADFV